MSLRTYLTPRGRSARRLRGKLRERAPDADPWKHAGLSKAKTTAMKRAQAAVGRYQDSHQLLHALSNARGWSPVDLEALFLAAAWIRAWEADKLHTRALAARLDRLDQDLAARLEDAEAGTDYEQLDYDNDESEDEFGDEHMEWRGTQVKRLPRAMDDHDRWRAGADAHYAARGLAVDPDLRWRMGGSMASGWVAIDGRPVRYPSRMEGRYPDHTWLDDQTGTAFPGRKHPVAPALYADVPRVELVPRYHDLVPPPRLTRETPVSWPAALPRRAVFEQTAEPLRRRRKWWLPGGRGAQALPPVCVEGFPGIVGRMNHWDTMAIFDETGKRPVRIGVVNVDWQAQQFVATLLPPGRSRGWTKHKLLQFAEDSDWREALVS